MPGNTHDDALSALRNHVDGPGALLAIWEAKAQDRPDAHIRRCANRAMDIIDAMLRELYGVRAQLTGEIRADEPPIREKIICTRSSSTGAPSRPHRGR
jgi:hypothetical protein